MTEATTRTLRTPAEYAAQPTDFFPPKPTSPAYLAPTETPPPPVYNTNNLQPSGRKQNAWLPGLVIALVLLTLITLGIVTLIKSRTPTPTPGTIPEPPAVTVPVEPPPPPPPPPGTRTGTNTISREFIYPGAETLMELNRADGGSLLQLRTTDSYENVLAWYTARLKPLTIQKMPGPSAILKSDKLMALINQSGSETTIMLKQLDKDEMDIDLDR